MARIPQDELERLKREVDLEELVREAGVELKGTGDNLLGLCPFHDDKNPSLVVTRSKNLWACKGACSSGGSVVDWVMRTEGVGFRHAVEILMERGGASPVVEGFRVGSGELASPLALGVPDEALLCQVVDYYHAVLEQSEAARVYLEGRGIADPEAFRAFKLGFVDRTLGLRIPRRNSAAGASIRDQLQRVGICRETGHEHFRGCVVVPVFDAEGRVAEIYGRRVERARNAPPHLYLPGPHRGVFNLDAFRASKEIILCESLVDALTFWCAGFRNVTSAYGTNGFTDEHLEAFCAYGVERALIAYDRDAAGDAAAKKVAERLGAEGISCWRVLFPRGMDANDYAVKVKPASQSLAVLLRSAEHLAGPVVTRSSLNRPVNGAPSDAVTPSLITSREPSLPFAASPQSGDDVMSQAIAASPEPVPPRLDLPAEVSDNEVVIRLDDRRWRVRGLERNLSFEQLRVNLLVSQAGSESYHVDTFDLYSARQRSVYVKQAATELGVRAEAVKRDLGKILLKLEELQEERIAKALEPKPEAPPMSSDERAEALALLEDPRLVERVGEAFDLCGLVGEETNRLVAYLAAVSRKLDRPLAVLVQSSSAAGKSALMEAALELMPTAERVHYSAMTGQSLFYMGDTDLKHKVLAIAEEEGAQRASYALKLLQSEGELSIASTGKDPSTGRLVTHEYRVEGPVAILMTTTAIDLDEELLNRCVVLTVDEKREQTKAIHERQREEETLSGWRRRRARGKVVSLHQNAQRLLKPLRVVNPFADALRFPDSSTRMRRDHQKYLSLIRSIALLHQRQREVRHDEGEPYVEVSLSDIELANRLAAEVLGRTLDELPPQTRRCLELVRCWVLERCKERGVEQPSLRFGRREVAEALGWSYSAVRKHLDRLVDLEHVLAHRGGRGQSFVYELLWDGRGSGGETFLSGLVDVEALRRSLPRALPPRDESFDPPLHPLVPSIDPRLSPEEPGDKLSDSSTYDDQVEKAPDNAHQGPSEKNDRYVRRGSEMKQRAGAA